uniref:Uncharacterized protein n=1 Tax=Solanum lycopersicum TaxID=4081 RepID=A0A3Q7GHC6_SOLLC
MQQQQRDRPESSIHHYAKFNLIASTNTSARRFSTESSSAVVCGEKLRKTEATLSKVIDLNCWGPSTVRF